MVNFPTILHLPQEDINRQLYEMIVKAGSGDDAAAIKALQEAIGDESTENTIIYMINAIAAAIEALQEAIGDESDATSILGRIKALETAAGG